MNDVEQSRSELVGELDTETKAANRKGAWLVGGLVGLKWFLYLTLAANTVLGIVATMLPHPEVVKPAYFALLSALAGGSYFLFTKTSWREKSEIHFAFRDTLKGLRGRLKYEQTALPHLPDLTRARDAIAAVSKDRTIARQQYTEQLKLANRSEDERMAKSAPEKK